MSKSTTTDLTITPKRLGLIEMDSFCPRCFWYLLRQKFHPPFDHFGGAIFSNMEQSQMAVVGHLLEEGKGLPEEFDPFCDLVCRIDFPRHWSKFKHTLDSGVLLYGVPDDLFEVSDGSIAVIDFKTAQPKGSDDPFMPCYEIQVIGYSFIAEFGLNLGEVSKGGLFYWGSEYKDVVAAPGKFYRNKKLWMPFAPKPHAIEIDYSRLDKPLEEAVRLWEARTPPERTDKCKDCKKLDALFAIEAEVEKQLGLSDQLVLSGSGHDRRAVQYVIRRVYNRQSARSSALLELRDDAMELTFAADGMVANWEMFHDHGF
jgi:PD-(D/E)XK nuclease superfamily